MRPSLIRFTALPAAAVLLASCASGGIDQPLRAASGLTSQLVCSGHFVAGRPAPQVFAQTALGLPGMAPLAWALSYEVDEKKQTVTARTIGLYESHAIYREGLGCLLVPVGAEMPQVEMPAAAPQPSAPQELPARLPEIASPAVVTPPEGALREALARAFADSPQPPQHRTQAVVVVHRGRVLAERYAPGFGVDAPFVSWSVAKSVTNALVGTLVRQGRLAVDAPADLPAWREPGDLRHAITLDMLMRQTSGLDLGAGNGAFDPSTRMKYVEPDLAGYAQKRALAASPGSHWAYADGHYMLVSRLVRDAVGGGAEVLRHYAQRELFAPLGMRHATIEFDATGTPLGSHSMYATARDWARFGLLYLNDGVVGGRRILPEGWVRYSTSRTLGSGYGAGFFTNLADGDVPGWGVPWGMAHAPRDTFFARGFTGQYVVIVPSCELVVVRLGPSQVAGDDIAQVDQLVGDVIAALPVLP